MATAISTRISEPTRVQPRFARAVGVVGAALAAAAIWVLAVPVLGVQLLVRFGSGAPQTVGIGFVIGLAVGGSVLGWAALALLEWRTVRARSVWTSVAAAALIFSLALPITAATTSSTLATLVGMHVAVAAVLIAALRRTCQDRHSGK